ncbi:hypothetical protein RhiirA1_484757 [Rhizophagus irregularis]|uniref:Uncharacterized protein n=1 Tax=Rhizophagus irregularis TaxID=588596 RepID=A0A2N0QIY1_9GLOM|nr:hypothetical protein RhiirA1_484757 [Rhizophagus irregularis]
MLLDVCAPWFDSHPYPASSDFRTPWDLPADFEESQGISAASKLRGPSINSSPNATSPQQHNSSLASVSQDSWIFWISSSIIRGGSWISHLDFLHRLTVQPLRISFW